MNSGTDTDDREKALPEELRGFSWAAFLWGGIWALVYRVWIGLFAFVPILGFIMHVVLALRGVEWAYRKGSIPDVTRFKTAQRNWVIAGIVTVVAAVPLVVGVFSAVAIFGVKKYIINAKRAEAKAMLAQMTRGMTACNARGALPGTSDWIPGDLSAVRGKKYLAATNEWSSQAAFSCWGFTTSTPQYYRYRWVQATTASGQFEAEADLNGDGVVDNAMQQGLHCSAGTCQIEPLLGDSPGAP